MKLLELVGVKKFADVDIDDVLDSMGHKELGRGTFGVTLKHSTKPEVIKFWMTDSAYNDFINYVAAHPYKNFPTLYSKPKSISSFFRRTTNFPDKVNYVKMEALEKFKDNINPIRDLFLMLSDECDNHKDVDRIINTYLTVPNMTMNKNYLDLLNSVISDVPKFCHEMFEMMHHVLKGKHYLDLHDENVMLRKNGELVITDPVVNDDDLQQAEEIEAAFWKIKRGEGKAIIGKTPRKTE